MGLLPVWHAVWPYILSQDLVHTEHITFVAYWSSALWRTRIGKSIDYYACVNTVYTCNFVSINRHVNDIKNYISCHKRIITCRSEKNIVNWDISVIIVSDVHTAEVQFFSAGAETSLFTANGDCLWSPSVGSEVKWLVVSPANSPSTNCSTLICYPGLVQ